MLLGKVIVRGEAGWIVQSGRLGHFCSYPNDTPDCLGRRSRVVAAQWPNCGMLTPSFGGIGVCQVSLPPQNMKVLGSNVVN